MSNCTFSYTNSFSDYKNISKKVEHLFSNKDYDKSCIILNGKINLFKCFLYFYNTDNKFDNYIYISSKGYFRNLDQYILDNNLYLNYYSDTIYFLKYNYKLYKIFNIYENRIDEHNFLNFLSDYYSSFNYIVNKNFGQQFIFPKNKFLYNKKSYQVIHEKPKNKKN